MIEGHTGDSRGVLRRWYDSIMAANRFDGWLLEYHPGGDWAGAGTWVDFVHDNVAAQLCAWPSGCIDTHTMRIPEDAEPAFRFSARQTRRWGVRASRAPSPHESDVTKTGLDLAALMHHHHMHAHHTQSR